MITPVNGHLIVEPVVHDGFIASQNDKFEEIGTIVAIDTMTYDFGERVKIGDRVYFDSWLAVKYPNPGGRADDFLWLVKWDDVRAIEKKQDVIA